MDGTYFWAAISAVVVIGIGALVILVLRAPFRHREPD
jgi:hypothetical protein